MGNTGFAWDPRKASLNLAKHGVFFVEAQSVFLDDSGRLIDDPHHSEAESRIVMLGYSLQARCPTVSHCYREGDSIIRLISARKATVKEEKDKCPKESLREATTATGDDSVGCSEC